MLVGPDYRLGARDMVFVSNRVGMVYFELPPLTDPRTIVDLVRRLNADVTAIFVSEETWRDMHHGKIAPEMVELPPLPFPPQPV